MSKESLEMLRKVRDEYTSDLRETERVISQQRQRKEILQEQLNDVAWAIEVLGAGTC
jgi:glycyl-tRNA synthetase beta subunit